MKRIACAAALCAALASWSAAAAGNDDPAAHLDAARAAVQKGDQVKAAREAETALRLLQQRLGKVFGDTLPVMPAPWKGDEIEVQSLAEIGGGLSVSRGYIRDDASINASLLLDAPAGDQNPAAPHTTQVKIGTEDAVMRFDPETKTGELNMFIDNRVVLEIQADNVASEKVLLDAAATWKVAKIRLLLAN